MHKFCDVTSHLFRSAPTDAPCKVGPPDLTPGCRQTEEGFLKEWKSLDIQDLDARRCGAWPT